MTLKQKPYTTYVLCYDNFDLAFKDFFIIVISNSVFDLLYDIY